MIESVKLLKLQLSQGQASIFAPKDTTTSERSNRTMTVSERGTKDVVWHMTCIQENTPGEGSIVQSGELQAVEAFDDSY